jgi:hypothetical protein
VLREDPGEARGGEAAGGGVSDPLSVRENGKTWFLYAFDYTTADGVFSSRFYAISDEHAQLVLQEIKETAVLRGRIVDEIPGGSAA